MPSKKLFLSSMVVFALVSLLFVGSVGASSEMWSQTYGGTASDSAKAMIQTNDGGYALAGETTSFGAGEYDFWLVKTDANGNMEWNQTYGRATGENAYALVETSDGGFALAGDTSIFSPETGIASDFWLVKTDANGNMEWNQTYSGGRAYALVETSDGGYALAGGALLVKTDGYGNMEWNQTYGGVSLVETSDGGYAIAGTKNDDFWLAKTDAQGIPEFPSWTPLIVTLTAVLVVAVIYRHYLNKCNQGRRKGEKVCISACSVDINSFA